MNNKFDHNDNDFGGEFPKPGVPADEAWGKMHAMLQQHGLTQQPKKDRRRLVVLLLVLFIIAGIGGYIYVNTDANRATGLAKGTHENTAVVEQNKTGKEPAGLQQNDNLKNDVASTGVSIPNTNRTEENYSLKNFNKTVSVNNSTVSSQPAASEKMAQQDNIPATATQQTSNRQDAPAMAPQQSLNKSGDVVATTNNNNSAGKDTIAAGITTNKVASNNTGKTAASRFHFGLQWNASFSLKNNSHYFNDYSGGKQYYMWLLPAAWAKMDIGKKHGLLFQFNPYKQVFAGKQTVLVEEPWIASVEPDIVTRAVKTRGVDLGLKYEYRYNKKLSITAGLGYTFQRNVLYAEQTVEHSSGKVLSEKLYAANRNDASFNYVKPSYLNWNSSVQYNFRKLSIGGGVNQPFSNLSADPAYQLKPLNGEIYLQYRLK